MKKLMVIFAALAMLTSSAYAADWNFYGSARVATFYTEVDPNTAGVNDTTNIGHDLQGNARIGANVKVSDELTARFEYGTGVNVRILYGEWNFGAGKLLVGQTYSPLNMFYSNQVYGSDNDLLNYGGVYGGRQPMVQLKFGNFKIAAVKPQSAAVVVGLVDGAQTANAITGAVSGNLETDDWAVGEQVMPKIEASYRLNMDNFHVAVQGGYNTYEIVNGLNTIDVDSYIGALGAGAKFGSIYINGNIWIGQNVGPYGLYNAPADDPAISANGLSLDDNDAYGYLLVAGYKLNDMFNFEVGYAQAQAEVDVTAAAEDEVKSYYIQSTITMAPGVFFIPEIGAIDNVEPGTTDTLYYGIKWQINF